MSGQLVNAGKTQALWLSFNHQPGWTFQWSWDWIPHFVVFSYLGCPLGFGVVQGARDDWLVSKVRDKLGSGEIGPCR